MSLSAAQNYLWRSTKECFAVLTSQVEEKIHEVSNEDILELRDIIERILLKGQSADLRPPLISSQRPAAVNPPVPSTPQQQESENEEVHEANSSTHYKRDKQPYTEDEKEIIRTALKSLPGTGAARKKARLALCRDKLCNQLGRREAGLMSQIRRLDRAEGAEGGALGATTEGEDEESSVDGHQSRSVSSTAVVVGQKRQAAEIDQPAPGAERKKVGVKVEAGASTPDADTLIWEIYKSGGEVVTVDGKLEKVACEELAYVLGWSAVKVAERLEQLKVQRG